MAAAPNAPRRSQPNAPRRSQPPWARGPWAEEIGKLGIQLEGALAGLKPFQPDILLPTQLTPRTEMGAYREQCLYAEIILSAIADAAQNGSTSKDRQRRADALYWFHHPDDDSCAVSLSFACDALGLDACAVSQALLLRVARQAAPSSLGAAGGRP